MIYIIATISLIAYLAGVYYISQMHRKELEDIRRRKLAIQEILNTAPKNNGNK